MPATVWKGYLSFGLVTFPVRLFTAARAKAVHFHMLHKKDLSRVKEVWYCAEEDRPIDRSEIVKGYQTSKQEYVVVDDKEIAAIAPPTASAIEIQQFVKSESVDAIYFENSYYLAPEEKASKPYSLFMAALTESRYQAVAKMAMHNREHAVLIRPGAGGLLLHTLYYADELNTGNRSEPAQAKFTAKELDLAKNLIRQMAGAFRPGNLHDAYRENLERLIEQKKKGQKITTVSQPRKTPVIDLMEALKRSLKSGSAQPSSTRKPANRHRAA